MSISKYFYKLDLTDEQKQKLDDFKRMHEVRAYIAEENIPEPEELRAVADDRYVHECCPECGSIFTEGADGRSLGFDWLNHCQSCGAYYGPNGSFRVGPDGWR
ncbi:MAG: hypothetical protein IJ555_09850 [Ruminococcus sp.]|nr:hypothetical protein [Ruminococcus sp.]